MITLLGTVVFAVVVAIGLADRNSGLSLLQRYDADRDGTERAPDGPPRARRDHSS